MAGPTLCISCASLPIKDREVATRIRRCPECKAELGISSYGKPFRARPARRGQLLTPTIFLSVCGGAVALMGVAALFFVVMLWRTDPQPRERPMAAVKPIVRVMPDPAPVPIPEMEVIPFEPPIMAPAAAPVQPAPPELLAIPEVALENPFPRHVTPQKALQDQRDLIGQIRRENAAKQDGFLLAQIDRRKELHGLPFIMGDDCKLDANEGKAFDGSVKQVRLELDQRGFRNGQGLRRWNQNAFNEVSNLAAFSQILAPEDSLLRIEFADRLAESTSTRASTILARMAMFDPSEGVRKAALASLKDRDTKEYAGELMQGMRYPMPIVAKRAADAMIALDRKDLLPHLVDFLGEARPGDPVAKKIDAKQVHVMREVVRINHHRNCLLCHPPMETGNPSEVPGAMPTPGQPFPQSGQYGNQRLSPGALAVRADITYLRQDFSVMLPVADAHPWPELQRFDFLVRTRVVEGNELAGLQKKMAERPFTYLSEQHQEALRVLRELSGQDAAPIQAVWRRVLGLNRPEE